MAVTTEVAVTKTLDVVGHGVITPTIIVGKAIILVVVERGVTIRTIILIVVHTTNDTVCLGISDEDTACKC